MRRGKRPAAGGTALAPPGPWHGYPLVRHHLPGPPGLPGPVAWAVGMPTTQPPRKPLSLLTHLAWDVLPGAAPEVVGGRRVARQGAGVVCPYGGGVSDAGELGAQNGYIKGCSPPRADGVGSAYGSPTRL
mgnify:FL=1